MLSSTASFGPSGLRSFFSSYFFFLNQSFVCFSGVVRIDTSWAFEKGALWWSLDVFHFHFFFQSLVFSCLFCFVIFHSCTLHTPYFLLNLPSVHFSSSLLFTPFFVTLLFSSLPSCFGLQSLLCLSFFCSTITLHTPQPTYTHKPPSLFECAHAFMICMINLRNRAKQKKARRGRRFLEKEQTKIFTIFTSTDCSCALFPCAPW